jgi:hypothetical protein
VAGSLVVPMPLMRPRAGMVGGRWSAKLVSRQAVGSLGQPSDSGSASLSTTTLIPNATRKAWNASFSRGTPRQRSYRALVVVHAGARRATEFDQAGVMAEQQVVALARRDRPTDHEE